MKTFFTILLITCSVMAYSQWHFINPKPLGYSLNDIHFVTTDIGYIVGNKGTVLKTLDGGENWEVLPQTVYKTFLLVWFCTPNIGYVVAESGIIYKTTNGGISWSEQGTGIYEQINGIFFNNEQTGFIVTETGDLYKTVDGGNTWIHKIASDLPLTSVSFRNENYGIATGYRSYFLTTNGGNSWQEFDCDYTLWDVTFFDEDQCFMSGRGGYCMKSSDGGNTWQEFYCGVSLDHLDFINNHTGYALTSPEFLIPESHNLYKTIDGGHTWTLLAFDNLRAFHVRHDNSLIAVGKVGRLLTTDDDCVTYTNYNPSVSYDEFMKIQFPSADTGYAFARNKTTIKTIDGGETWDTLPSFPTLWRNGMWFTDNQTGFVTADSNIYKTTDGGMSWTNIFTASDWLSEIYFYDRNNGYVIGEWFGSLYKTEDGGATWNFEFQELFNARSIQFISRDTGFISLYNTILKTTDGGSNWIEIEVDNSAVLNGMHFINGQLGYLCADNYYTHRPNVYKTIDGGQNWMQQVINDSYDTPLSIYFIDQERGFLGCSGNFYQTNNGGESWVNIEYMEGYFNSMCFSDQNTGFVTGMSGAIWKTDNAGAVSVTSIEKPASVFILHPNPANESITIESKNPYDQVILNIYNANGVNVHTGIYERNPVKIHTSDLPGGVYFIRINTLKGVEIKKFIVI